MMEENVYEVQLQEELDHFQPQVVLDWVMGIIIGCTIIVCLVLNIIHLWGMFCQKRIEREIKKEREQAQKIIKH